MRAILTAAILCSVFQVLPGMVGSAAAQHYDCAHGPDYYRVRNVASHDHLNVRARPSSRSVRVVPFRTMEFGSNVSGRAKVVGARWIGLGPLDGSIRDFWASSSTVLCRQALPDHVL